MKLFQHMELLSFIDLIFHFSKFLILFCFIILLFRLSLLILPHVLHSLILYIATRFYFLKQNFILYLSFKKSLKKSILKKPIILKKRAKFSKLVITTLPNLRDTIYLYYHSHRFHCHPQKKITLPPNLDHRRRPHPILWHHNMMGITSIATKKQEARFI